MKEIEDTVRQIVNAKVGPVEPARHLGAVEGRKRLIEKMLAARQDIAQMFIDAEHWNTQVRKPDEEPIDPDPDGLLREIAAHYDRLLKNDVQ